MVISFKFASSLVRKWFFIFTLWGDETGSHVLLSRGWGSRDKRSIRCWLQHWDWPPKHCAEANRLVQVRLLPPQLLNFEGNWAIYKLQISTFNSGFCELLLESWNLCTTLWGDETGSHVLLSRGWGSRDKHSIRCWLQHWDWPPNNCAEANRLVQVRLLPPQQKGSAYAGPFYYLTLLSRDSITYSHNSS